MGSCLEVQDWDHLGKKKEKDKDREPLRKGLGRADGEGLAIKKRKGSSSCE